MYVIIAPLHIKDGFKEQFIKELIEDARGAINDEPGCLRFDVTQDANDGNKIWVYEAYRDEAAFQAHLQSPHYTKFKNEIEDWLAQNIDLDLGAGAGASNIWPTDNEWLS